MCISAFALLPLGLIGLVANIELDFLFDDVALLDSGWLRYPQSTSLSMLMAPF